MSEGNGLFDFNISLDDGLTRTAIAAGVGAFLDGSLRGSVLGLGAAYLFDEKSREYITSLLPTSDSNEVGDDDSGGGDDDGGGGDDDIVLPPGEDPDPPVDPDPDPEPPTDPDPDPEPIADSLNAAITALSNATGSGGYDGGGFIKLVVSKPEIGYVSDRAMTVEIRRDRQSKWWPCSFGTVGTLPLAKIQWFATGSGYTLSSDKISEICMSNFSRQPLDLIRAVANGNTNYPTSATTLAVPDYFVMTELADGTIPRLLPGNVNQSSGFFAGNFSDYTSSTTFVSSYLPDCEEIWRTKYSGTFGVWNLAYPSREARDSTPVMTLGQALRALWRGQALYKGFTNGSSHSLSKYTNLGNKTNVELMQEYATSPSLRTFYDTIPLKKHFSADYTTRRRMANCIIR